MLHLESELGQDHVSAQEAEAQEQLVRLSFGFGVCPNPEELDGSLALVYSRPNLSPVSLSER